MLKTMFFFYFFCFAIYKMVVSEYIIDTCKSVRYVPDWYKNQQVCDKAILENSGTLSLFLTSTKIKKCVTKQLIITPDQYKT